MTTFLILGLILIYALTLIITVKWGGVRMKSEHTVGFFTFSAILFTSAFDSAFVMYPFVDFSMYSDAKNTEQFGWTNPVAIEFGFWSFLVWLLYFSAAFYFSMLEPKVKFFEKKLVKWANNLIIISNCGITITLFLKHLPEYIPSLGDGKTLTPVFYFIAFVTIVLATLSSTHIRYVKILSVGSVGLLAVLAFSMLFVSGVGFGDFLANIGLVGGYFGNIHKFAFPFNDYHAFYLYWWFSWAIMVGQFAAKFVNGLTTRQVLMAMTVSTAVPILIWLAIVYGFWANNISAEAFTAFMALVACVFIINTQDSLIRLYTDNVGFTYKKYGIKYIIGNVALLSVLGVVFKYGYLSIHGVGAAVIVMMMATTAYTIIYKRDVLGKVK